MEDMNKNGLRKGLNRKSNVKKGFMEFFEKKKQYDPHGLFRSKWSDHYMREIMPDFDFPPLTEVYLRLKFCSLALCTTPLDPPDPSFS